MKPNLTKSKSQLGRMLCFIALSQAAEAAPIFWNTPSVISGDSDIFAVGLLSYAYTESNTATTVNGVSFAAGNSTTALGANVTLSGFTGEVNTTAFSTPTGLSPAYALLTQGAAYANGGTPATITLNNLVAGHVYATQIWVNDSRSTGSGRSESLTSVGGNTITLDYNNTETTGGAGQFSIGRFGAAATTQTMTLTGNTSTQLNGLQVRDITNIGNWVGSAGSAWDAATTANFADNAYTSALNTVTFATAQTPLSAVTFADSYWNSGSATTVTQNAVAIAAGGVSTGTVYLSNAAVDYTFTSGDSAGITGATKIIKDGSGLVTFAGENSYTGSTTLSGGILNLGHTGALAGGGNITFFGGTLQFSSSNTNDYAAKIVNSTVGSISLDTNGQSVIFANALAASNTAGLTKLGAGTLILTGANAYTGTTTVSSGTLQVGNAGTTGSLGNGAVVTNAALVYSYDTNSSANLPSAGITGTGTVSATAKNIVFNGNVTTGGSQVYNATANTGALSTGGNINAGTVALTTTGSGSSITLSGDFGKAGGSGNNLALDTSAGNGAINLNISLGRGNDWYNLSSFTANAGTGAITVSGSYLASAWNSTPTTLTGAISISGNLPNNGPLTLNTTAPSTITGILSGNGALTKTGASTLILSNTNTYTGTTTVSNGTLQVGNGGTTGTLGSGAVITNAALVYSYNSSGTASLPSVGITGTGTVTATAKNINFNGNVTTGGSQSYNATSPSGLYQGGNIIATTVALTTTSPSSSISLVGDYGKTGSAGNNLVLDTSAGNEAINLDISLGRSNVFYPLNTFSANAGTGVITLSGSRAVNGWNATTSSLTGTINISSNVPNTSAMTLNTTGNSTITGILSGGGSLTKSGNATLTLSAVNTYSGPTTISAGTLATSGPNSLSLNSAITVANGATLSTTAATNNTQSINTLLTLNGGTVSAGGGTTASGYNQFYFNTAGGITASNNAVSTISAGISLNGRDVYNDNGGFTKLTVDTGATLAITGNVAGVSGTSWGGISKYGTGTLFLNGSNTTGYAQGMYVTAGTVEFSTNALGMRHGSSPHAGFAVDFVGNATLRWATGNTQDVSGNLGNGSYAAQQIKIGDAITATFDTNGNNVTLATALATGVSATGLLTKIGAGNLTLSAANTYTGATTINDGTLVLSGLGNSNNSNLTLANNANITFAATDSRSFTKAITGTTGGTVGFNVAGNTSDTGGGDPTNFQLNNTGAFTAAVSINTGLVSPSGNAAFGDVANVIRLNASSGNTAGLVGTTNLTLPSTRSIQLSNSGGNGIFRAYGSTTFQIDGAISGSGNFVKTDGGTVILTGTNTYTGTTRIGQGNLSLSGAGSLADTTAVTLAAGTVFDIAGISGPTTEKIGRLSAGSGSTIQLGSNTLEFGDGNADTISASITGSGGSINKTGSSTVTINGTSTYTGTTMISGGTLLLGPSGSLPDTAGLQFAGGNTKFSTGGYNDTTGPLSLSGSAVAIIDLGGTTSQLSFSGISSTWSGVLSVWNWNGSIWNAGNASNTRLFFTDATTNSANISGVQFFSDAGSTPVGSGAAFVGNELVAVPEPSVMFTAGTLLGMLTLRRTRKLENKRC